MKPRLLTSPSSTIRAGLLGLVLAGAACAAAAHDTWFEPRPSPPGTALLALGTGNRFPRHDSGLGAEFLTRQGCRSATGVALALRSDRNAADAVSVLLLRPVHRAASTASHCWAQLQPFDVEVAPALVPVYLNEIRASAAVRSAWAALQARGLPWKERYTKHARIMLRTPPGVVATVGTEPAADLGLDIIANAGTSPLRVGQTLDVRVLRDGEPLAGLALELRSELSPIGIWHQTDAQGRLGVRLPLAGRWLLRGVDLHLANADGTEVTDPADADHWASRFVTLAFEVEPADRADQNPSSLRLNARSANQTAAIAAISSEPPTRTP